MTHAFLPDRAFIEIGGADAESFLQNLITTDLAGLEAGEAAPGALLTPQGKILFLFLISRREGGFRLETDSASRDNLLKRLTMYRLRAAVTLDATDGSGVSVHWDEPAAGLRDRRFARAGVTLVREPGNGAAEGSDIGAYEALRVAHGIAEKPADHAEGDAFPHDILLDLSGGLSFRKGCYVGQEVVSRMQHRGTARRRLVTVKAEAPLAASGAPLTTGGKALGPLGTVSGNRALAIVRTDRAGQAMANGQPILADDKPVSLTLPAWSGLAFPTDSAGDEA
jgi:folate-binding protein YgfZ